MSPIQATKRSVCKKLNSCNLLVSIFLLFILITLNECAHIAKTSGDHMERELNEIITDVQRDLPFDISPRYVRFRPPAQLQARIQRIAEAAKRTDVNIIRERLYREHDPYVVIALIYILEEVHQDDARQLLVQYKIYLGSHEPFMPGFPSKLEVLDDLDQVK